MAAGGESGCVVGVWRVVNHFVWKARITSRRLRRSGGCLFGATAVLLAMTEALGSGLAFWRATHVRVR